MRPELTVGALIVDEEGRILLVVSPKWRYLYSIPGGHVKFGERIFDAVSREALEEVGLRVRPIQIISIQEVIRPAQFTESKRHFLFVDVLCKPLSKTVQADGSEIMGYVWASPKQALQLPLERYTRKLVEFYSKNRRNSILVALDA
ncbi:MAG: NUDIX domain-containing protein [Candidatus Caldarchaeum sp.]|nr:NUDIX domain-containing protein [Candidatus Caldarchaeum sp.]MDW8062595.1 NUDIX domain-containing protein [Candidatus Caldarchaeum sp.]